jgi:hypothetical protein
VHFLVTNVLLPSIIISDYSAQTETCILVVVAFDVIVVRHSWCYMSNYSARIETCTLVVTWLLACPYGTPSTSVKKYFSFVSTCCCHSLLWAKYRFCCRDHRDHTPYSFRRIFLSFLYPTIALYCFGLSEFCYWRLVPRHFCSFSFIITTCQHHVLLLLFDCWCHP